MSLINEMLRDLDARRAPNGGAAVPAEVRVVRAVATSGGDGGRPVMLAAGAVAVLAVVGWWVWQEASVAPEAEEIALPPAVITQVTPVPPVSEAAAVAQVAEPRPEAAVASGLPEAEARVQRRETRAPAARTPAPTARSGPSRTTPPLVAETAAVSSKIEAEAPALRIADSLAMPSGTDASQIDKRVVPLRAGERAAASYRRALLAAQAGQPAEARQFAEAALRDEPGHVGARQLLVRLLLDGRDDAEAMELLARSQRDFPDDLQWALLLARLNLESKGAGPALAQLQQAREPAAGSHEYRAMLAALHHRLGDNRSAVQAYRGALQLAPQEGRYWAGLAISLDQLGEGEAAQQAYRQAAVDAGLPPSLATLVRERIR